MFTSKYTTSFKREVVKFYINNHSVKEVLQKYQIAESTLFVWKQEYKKSNFRKRSVNHCDLYKQRAHYQKLENIIKAIKLSNCDIHASIETKIAVIENLSNKFSVRVLCEAVKLPRGTYYNRIRRKKLQTQSQKHDIELKGLIQRIFESSNERFGKKPIKQKLLESGYQVSEKRISRLMKELGLYVKTPVFMNRYKRLSLRQERFKNLLDREFTQDKPNRVWVSDISSAKTIYLHLRDYRYFFQKGYCFSFIGNDRFRSNIKDIRQSIPRKEQTATFDVPF